MTVDRIGSLWLIVTYQCPARCAHCLFGAGPEFREWMSLETAREYVGTLFERNPLHLVGIVGGEAMLRPELAVAMAKMAKDYGVPEVIVAGTNCFWATDDETTRDILILLKERGIRIGFSMDAFHQEFIPVERVMRACRIARELGMGKTDRPDATVIEAMDADNPYDSRTRALTDRLDEQGYGVDLNRGGLLYAARAAGLSKFFRGDRSIPRERCRGAPWVCGDFAHPPSVQIDCNGWVMVEHGISIGNARERPLADILDGYEPASNPIIGTLMARGPIGLTELQEANGFRLCTEGYVNKCHLCCEVRSHLRPFFPDILVPANCYPAREAVRDTPSNACDKT